MFTVHCWHSVSMAVTSLTQISYRMISVSISVLSFIVAWQYANAITATIVLSVCPSVTLVSCDKTVERIDFLDRILPSVNAGLCCNGIHTARKRITYLPRNLNFLNSENLPFFFSFFSSHHRCCNLMRVRRSQVDDIERPTSFTALDHVTVAISGRTSQRSRACDYVKSFLCEAV